MISLAGVLAAQQTVPKADTSENDYVAWLQFQQRLDSVTKQQVSALLEQARSGETDAQLLVGIIYYNGHLVKRDMRIAAEMLTKAAESGSGIAAGSLAELYDLGGKDFPRDPEKALKWYQLAVARGNPRAEDAFSEFYLDGRGLDSDPQKAVAFLTNAAEKGDVVAQMTLAKAYLHERKDWPHLPKDEPLGFSWMKRAAEAGCLVAQARVAALYALGRGTPKDPREAVRWTRLAADRGEPHAMSALGRMYEAGYGGLPQDDTDALMWYMLAEEGGIKYSHSGLTSITRGMTPMELDSARQKKNSWNREHGVID